MLDLVQIKIITSFKSTSEVEDKVNEFLKIQSSIDHKFRLVDVKMSVFKYNSMYHGYMATVIYHKTPEER